MWNINGLKAEGWSGLKKIILGAREHILDGAVREILAEEAGRKTITEWRISTNSVELGETWQMMGLILHTNRRKEAINGIFGPRWGDLIWIGFDELDIDVETWSPACYWVQKGSVDQQSCCETSHPTVNYNKPRVRNGWIHLLSLGDGASSS